MPAEDLWESYSDAAYAAAASSASGASYSTTKLEKINSQWFRQTVIFSGDGSGRVIETHSDGSRQGPAGLDAAHTCRRGLPHRQAATLRPLAPPRSCGVRRGRVGEADEKRHRRAGDEEQPQEDGVA